MTLTSRGPGWPKVKVPDKWDLRYYFLAMHVASWSKDPRTRVGAVAIGGADLRHIALGYNGFPPGIEDLPERYDDPQTKYLFVQHAERNVLDNANFDLRGGTLVCTMFPCVECTKSLISKGITRLITSEPPEPLPNGEKSWRDTVPAALQMLREAHVRVTIIDQGEDAPYIPGVREIPAAFKNCRDCLWHSYCSDNEECRHKK